MKSRWSISSPNHTALRTSPHRQASSFLGWALLAALLSPAHVAADWLQWGGPDGDFKVETQKLAERWPADGPKTLWKKPLGTGYSAILYRGGRLFTMYREDEQEVVASLEAKTGEMIWQHRYDTEFWPDMTPAFGLGPNATPLIVGDRIISIGISGQMRSLDVASGKLLWKRDLPAEFGRRERIEEYGYSNSPLHYKGKIIVAVGGTDHGVVAFDPVDGTPTWKSPPGGISYAPATLTTLDGQDQFIYFSPEGVIALDPTNGRKLWDSAIEFSNGNHLTPIVKCDEHHIWVGSQFASGGGRLLEVRAQNGAWSAEQIWFKSPLRAAHSTSIRIGDFIYGSSGGNSTSVLTAFDWKTGEIAWRHRGFHKAQSLYADGKLLFLDEEGQLVLAKISPEAFEVLDSAQVTGSVSWTLPTLVGTTLYVRDQESILALDLSVSGGSVSGEGEPRPKEKNAERRWGDPAWLEGDFGKFIRQVDRAQNKRQLIDAFMKKEKEFPIIEGDSLVHFVFRGEVLDVGIMGNFLDSRGSVEPLHHLENTDLYFRSYQLAPAAHFEYRFNVFDDEMRDPLNPRTLSGSDDESSVVTTPGWTEPAHLQEPVGARGRIETFTWKSAILENEREIKVYLPVGYDTEDQRYPVVMVNYGDRALNQGRWASSLDNLIGKSVAPVLGVFIPRVDFDDYADRVAQFADAIEHELIPHIDEHYRSAPGAENRAMTGIASGAFASAYLALESPQVVGKVALRSFYFRAVAEEKLRAMVPGRTGESARFYVEWSLNDLNAPPEMQSERHSRELAALLSENGYDVITHETSDGAGWGSWRARTDQILEGFFPSGPER